MSAATNGVQGRCAHCRHTLPLKPWQLNAIAINEAFTCSHCQKSLHLSDPKQIKRFKSNDSLALLQTSAQIMVCTALLVALVMEWMRLLSVLEQVNFSLLAIFVYFIVIRFARHRQHITLTLDAAKTHIN
jgi:Zn ribbon nucleic-acid-binding protein